MAIRWPGRTRPDVRAWWQCSAGRHGDGGPDYVASRFRLHWVGRVPVQKIQYKYATRQKKWTPFRHELGAPQAPRPNRPREHGDFKRHPAPRARRKKVAAGAAPRRRPLSGWMRMLPNVSERPHLGRWPALSSRRRAAPPSTFQVTWLFMRTRPARSAAANMHSAHAYPIR